MSALPASAQDNGQRCELGGYDPDLRPDPDGVATTVGITLFVVDIEQVDDVDQSFRADLFTVFRWTDPRLAASVRASGRENCRFSPEAVWTPQIVLFNRRDTAYQAPPRLVTDHDGNVEFIHHVQGTFRSPFDLREFPRDIQHLPLTFVSTEYGPEQLNLVVDQTTPVHAETMAVSGWSIVEETREFGVFRTEGTSATGGAEQFAQFDYRFHVRRELGYYVFRVIVPLTFIVLMSWAVFWIDPDMAGVQMGLAATSILTLIAFLFSLNAILPRLPYLTRMDVFLFASLAIVFFAFAEAVATAVLTKADRDKLALRIDRAARWVFPVLFATIIGVVWTL